MLLPKCVCLRGSAPDPAEGFQRPSWQTLGLTIAEGPTELRAPGPRDPTIRHCQYMTVLLQLTIAQTIKIMLKGNARSLNKLMRLHFLNYILTYILQIVIIIYIATYFFLYTLITDIVIIHSVTYTVHEFIITCIMYSGNSQYRHPWDWVKVTLMER